MHRFVIALALVSVLGSACKKSQALDCGDNVKPDDKFAKLGGFPPGAMACHSPGGTGLYVALPGDHASAIAKVDAYMAAAGFTVAKCPQYDTMNLASAEHQGGSELRLYKKASPAQVETIQFTDSKVEKEIVISPSTIVDCDKATSIDDKDHCKL